MDDIRRVFDVVLAFSAERQRLERVARLQRDIAVIGTRCGDCDKWMKSRICPKERNVQGYTRGPSMASPICGQFVEASSATERRADLQARLSQENAP